MTLGIKNIAGLRLEIHVHVTVHVTIKIYKVLFHQDHIALESN